MSERTVKGFFDALESRLNADPSKLAGMNSVYQFRVGEESYHVAMKDGKAAVAAGDAPAPNCSVTMAETDSPSVPVTVNPPALPSPLSSPACAGVNCGSGTGPSGSIWPARSFAFTYSLSTSA